MLLILPMLLQVYSTTAILLNKISFYYRMVKYSVSRLISINIWKCSLLPVHLKQSLVMLRLVIKFHIYSRCETSTVLVKGHCCFGGRHSVKA